MLERFINSNRKIEAAMEGSPNLVVSDGVINWDCMKRDNISKEDLFRALRSKDVQHLGEVKKAFFETSGAVSVFFYPPKKVRAGLAVLHDEMLHKEEIFKEGMPVPDEGIYCCLDCGHAADIEKDQTASRCELCNGERWVKAEDESSTVS